MIRDLVDKTMIVTGASSGIGVETVRGLARRGARVIATARSRWRGEDALGEIKRSDPRANVELVVFDLASLADVRRGAREILERAPRIDVLVNNAGLIQQKRTTTVDGHETTFAVNHLGPFLLTLSLIDRLREAPAARVVNVSARAHTRCGGLRVRCRSAQRVAYRATAAYNHAKLANLMFTSWSSREAPGFERHRQRGSPRPCAGAVRRGRDPGASPHGIAWRLIQPRHDVPGGRSRVHHRCATEWSSPPSQVFIFEQTQRAPPSRAAQNLPLRSDLVDQRSADEGSDARLRRPNHMSRPVLQRRLERMPLIAGGSRGASSTKVVRGRETKHSRRGPHRGRFHME
ncbi:MAG: SDR family NAD(P)-dependent oxidoreductase [Polyangiaceae bacterium]